MFEILGWIVGSIVGLAALAAAAFYVWIWYEQKKGRNPFN